ncbi:hypothetical protein [Paenibacillus humicus]|uniref:hypothetical protein n=1 Tax=Paenibacillus humicus TaxID=412861 RepID=UPI000FD70B77|nr:hypothetical protein [Paenibacillus humicus]
MPVTRSLKAKVDKENKLIFVWMLEQQKDSDEFVELKAFAKSSKFKVVTFISGKDDLNLALENLILDNALINSVDSTG